MRSVHALMLFGLLLIAPSITAAEDPFAGFADRVEAERVKWGAPGLAIAVVHKGEVVFESGFGVRNLDTGEPVDEHTLFHVGSTTKAFIAAALGVLVDQGKMRWTDRVIDHLPQFRVADPYVTRELTIIDILSHRSGVQTTDLTWFSGMKPDEVLARLAYAEQATSLRSEYAYNNGMFIVAGEVIVAVSGQPFETFVREQLFLPLDMTRTTGPISEVAQRSNVAISHAPIDGKMTPIGLTDRYDPGAAGLFYSSVSEYANWLRMWLHEGEWEGDQILSAEVVEMAFTPHTLLAKNDIYPAAKEAGADIFAYGLAWFLQTYRGHRVNMHTGSLDGMAAIVGLLPEEELGMVAFINGDHVEIRHALMYEVFDRILGGPSRDWSAELRPMFEKMNEEATLAQEKQFEALELNAKAALPLDSYAGLYRSPLWGDYRLELEGNNLILTAGTLLTFDLSPAGGHTFVAQSRDRHMGRFILPFSVGGDNEVISLKFRGNEISRAAE